MSYQEKYDELEKRVIKQFGREFRHEPLPEEKALDMEINKLLKTMKDSISCINSDNKREGDLTYCSFMTAKKHLEEILDRVEKI